LGATVWFLAKALRPTTAFAGLTFALFFVGNGIGLAFPAAAMTEFSNYMMEDRWLNTAGVAYLPLLAAGIVVMVALRRRESLPSRSVPDWELGKLGYVIVLVSLTIGTLLMLRYMQVEGWQRARAWNEIADRHTAYSTRYSFDQVTGQGAFSSVIAAFCLVPTASLFLLLYGRRWNLGLRLLLVAGPLLLSMLRAAANLQRSGLILQGLLVLVVFAAPLFGRQSGGNPAGRVRIPWGMASWAGAVFLGVGMLVYARSDDRSPLASLSQRVFVTTSHTAALYFGVFPEMEPFRGWSGTLSVPVGSWEQYDVEEVNLKLLGYYANGNPHNANSNFVVSAYSGGGWSAAIAFQLAYAGIIAWVSHRIGAFSGIFPYLAFILSIHGLFAISQADVAGASSIGFGWEQALILAMMRFAVVDRSAKKLGNDTHPLAEGQFRGTAGSPAT
jgi:hypothetical protein